MEGFPFLNLFPNKLVEIDQIMGRASWGFMDGCEKFLNRMCRVI